VSQRYRREPRPRAPSEAETTSEIVAATADGMTRVYPDSPGEQIGFADIAVPEFPQSAGTVPMWGEPTSVGVLAARAIAYN
jgi:hypothetical protein